MSISRQNLTVVIVTLKSDNVIHNCIKSINQNIPIIVVEHSNNQAYKIDLESKYKNLSCILSKSNIGMGPGNNIGIKSAKTEYVLILNPDVILEENTIEELLLASQSLKDYTILAPLEKNFINYGVIKQNALNKNLTEIPFEVDFVDGFAMLINKKKFQNNNYFDENIFMYLENTDLCKRVKDIGGSIFVIPKSKINHLSQKAVHKKFNDEVELSRNWHWIWSKFYFTKKHFGFTKAFIEGFPRYCSSLIKFLYYFITINDVGKKKYFNRASGFYNAFLGKSSWYRPNLND